MFRLLLLFTLFAYAGTFNKDLQSYFSKINGDDTRSIKNFNSIKMLYLDTILGENEKNQFIVLDKLLKASKIIKLKVPSSYESEFERLSSKYKKNYKSPKKKKSKTSNFRKKINNNNGINYLKAIKKQYKGVFLTFSKTLSKEDIRYHIWKSKGYFHHIYDIENSRSNQKTKTIKFNVGKVTIGQYKKNVLRLSLKSKYKRLSKFSIYKKKINITFRENTAKNKVAKKVTKPKKKKRKKIPEYRIRSSEKSFTNKIIIIDPGHGGKDGGTSSKRGIKEKNIVLRVSKYLRGYLQDKGFKVYLTRSNDKYVDLRKRTKIANRKKADLFISIHANSTRNRRTTGIETYFLSTSRSKKAKNVALRENSLGVKSLGALSKNVLLNVVNRKKIVASNKLAIDIQRNLLVHTSKNGYSAKDHGVRGGPFWVLVGARMPNVLIELGYLSNTREANKLNTRAYQKILARGISMGIESYLEKN